jgi:protein SCO1
MPATDPAALVERLRHDPDGLAGLLREDHPIHAGRSTRATAEVRARALVALAEGGTPAAALPYVVEELENGDEPVLVAAAARAVRGVDPPDIGLAGPLVAALTNAVGNDDVVALDGRDRSWPPAQPTTAVREVLAALRGLGPGCGAREALAEVRASRGHLLAPEALADLDATIAAMAGEPTCCGHHAPLALSHEPPPDAGPLPADILVEDQDGQRVRLTDHLSRAPTVLAMFYTRCANPRKCSLTITSLAAVARDLAAAGRLGDVQVAALSYDPGYDTPARLRRYGLDRGLPFGPAVRMFRAVDGQDRLREQLELHVGYAGSVVNRHAVELYLLDRSARPVRVWSRRRWAPADVLSEALAAADTGWG